MNYQERFIQQTRYIMLLTVTHLFKIDENFMQTCESLFRQRAITLALQNTYSMYKETPLLRKFVACKSNVNEIVL